MSIYEQYLDNLREDGITLRDFQHAERLFIDQGLKHAPKHKFLYHVTFFLSDEAKTVIPELANYTNEIGILVKSADLPSYQAAVEVKNKYNRKKNIQTSVNYREISIDFHDDNFGITTALLEAYFKYYFADSKNTLSTAAYGIQNGGDTLYEGEEFNKFQFGMDNDTPNKAFFNRIEIAQLSRRQYTKYILVNPLISDWSHDSVEYSDSQGIMQNSISINYETVLYERGSIEGGLDGNPAGFGSPQNYDQTPSPLKSQSFDALGINETQISEQNTADTSPIEQRIKQSTSSLAQITDNAIGMNSLFSNPPSISSIGSTVIPKTDLESTVTNSLPSVRVPRF